ncbi:MAG: NAD(P)/FAD-dependent oxidoreductase [Sneathiella sp.]|nr:NAD(P)/FAD-dependent oxidoreductase [Sneathiella sp.]
MNNKTLSGVSDADLRDALEEANIPTLLLVLAQITGDQTYITGQELPSTSLDGIRNISNERQTELKEDAFQLFKKMRAGEITVAPMPKTETLQKMLSVFVNDNVGSEYVPMFLEDMGFSNSLDTQIIWEKSPANTTLDENHVIIVGSGISGISAGIHLKKAGIPFTILEKNNSVGGTWYENTYPACGVDTPNHFYSFSFEPNSDWTSYYSKRDEIFSYIKDVAEKYGIMEHIRFECRVDEATYDETSHHWDLQIRNADGQTEKLNSRFFISAVGQLNRPVVPEFKGKSSFSGPNFHSANWRHDVDLKGKKVVVIGTGASAMQLCPEIAKTADSLTVVQRTPHWIRILPDYHKTVSPGKMWLLKHLPFYKNWYRFRLFWSYGDGIWDSLHFDENWPDKEQSLNAENAHHRRVYIRNLTDALDGDEDLLKKVVPSYPPFAKRMLIDNKWCDMLKRPNVELATAAVEEITENGVRDSNGAFHEADVIIYATGFDAGNLLGSMNIPGRKGANIHKIWGEDPRAFLGMTAPQFPNFFMFYGPNTNLGHGGSLIFHIECQSRYITKCIMKMVEAGYDELEIRSDIHDAYNEKVDAEHNSMIWTHPGVSNWYRNSKGRVVANSPWRLVDYWTMTSEVNLDNYKLVGKKAPSS